jgi:tetratricopeptide (TPR) repeat protein
MNILKNLFSKSKNEPLLNFDFERKFDYTDFLRQAEIEFEKGNFEKSILYSEKAMEVESNDYNIYNQLGLSYLMLGDVNKAMTFANQSVKISPSVIGYSIRGKINKEENKHEAIDDYLNVIKLNGDVIFEDSHFQLGNLYYEVGDYQSSVNEFNKLISLNPNNSQFYYLRGFSILKVGDINAAISDVEKAVQLDPDNLEYRTNLAYIYGLSNNNDKALTTLDYVLERNPNSITSLTNRMIAKIKNNDTDGAYKDILRIIKLDDKNIQAWLNKGNIELKLASNENEEFLAFANFNRAISIDPNNAEAYYVRGVAYKIVNNKAEACKDFQQSMKLGEPRAIEMINGYCNISDVE